MEKRGTKDLSRKESSMEGEVIDERLYLIWERMRDKKKKTNNAKFSHIIF